MKRIDDIWEKCPEAEIIRLTNSLRFSRRIYVAARAAAVVAIALTIITAFVLMGTLFAK